MSRTCSTCIHDGCCDGLPNCGGSCWQSAFGACNQCGDDVYLGDVEFEDDDGHVFCSEECMNTYAEENKEENEEDEDGKKEKMEV